MFLTVITLQSPFCYVRLHSHRCQGFGHLWGVYYLAHYSEIEESRGQRQGIEGWRVPCMLTMDPR